MNIADRLKRQEELLYEKYGEKRIQHVKDQMENLRVDVPSWGFNRGGTRFGSYSDGSEAKSTFDRIQAAKKAYEATGLGEYVAFHFPWDGDSLDDIAPIKNWLKEAGLKPGAINTNMFEMRNHKGLDHRVKLGSFTNPHKDIQKKMVEHNLEALEFLRYLESDSLSLWFPDGTNSPGQLSMYDQADWLEKNLQTIYKAMKPKETLYIEYKFFEPAFYSTAIPDWGRALSLCKQLGDHAKVLVDLGHHPLGTNIEQIVAFLIREKKLGGFHFNDKKYADDDLATASLDPFQLFRVFVVINEGKERGYFKEGAINYLLDQSHCIKHPTDEVIESLQNIKRLYAKALLVDEKALQDARLNAEPTQADEIINDAFWEDVSPLLAL